MEKIQIIDQIIDIFEKNLEELRKLKENVKQEEEFNSILLNKIKKIENDTDKIRQGIIG